VDERDGSLYVADSENYAVRKISPEGYVTTLYRNYQCWDCRKMCPVGIAVDERNGNIFVSDNIKSVIFCMSPEGEIKCIAGTESTKGFVDGPAKSAMFSWPTCLLLDTFHDILYIADKNRIRKMSIRNI